VADTPLFRWLEPPPRLLFLCPCSTAPRVQPPLSSARSVRPVRSGQGKGPELILIAIRIHLVGMPATCWYTHVYPNFRQIPEKLGANDAELLQNRDISSQAGGMVIHIRPSSSHGRLSNLPLVSKTTHKTGPVWSNRPWFAGKILLACCCLSSQNSNMS
jgi:hypothetical protein